MSSWTIVAEGLSSVPARRGLMVGAAVALAAAVLFAVGSVLQQEVAAATSSDQGALNFRRLLTRPAWLAGQVATVVGTGLQVIALALAPVSFVQPVLASGLVVALAARSIRDRHPPSRTALVGAACTTLGLAVFLVTARPAAGAAHDLPGTGSVLLAVVLSVACVALASRTGKGSAGALACGTAAGLAMAVAAVLIAAALKTASEQGIMHAVGSAPLWGALVTALAAELASQQAFARGHLAWSLPALTVVDPIAAVPVARMLLGEHLAAGHTAAWLPAAFVAGLGVVLLARTEPVCRPPLHLPPGHADPTAGPDTTGEAGTTGEAVTTGRAGTTGRTGPPAEATPGVTRVPQA